MRLALFGGTFDPIHSGHIQAAVAAATEHSLDRILVIPCGNPPHKPGSCGASYEQRYRMVQLACEADSRLVASRLEEPLGGDEPNYSIDTVRRVQSMFEFDRPLRFIIGVDAFAEIEHWRDSAEVRAAVEFLIVGRPDSVADVSGHEAISNVKRVDCAHPASSQEIRHRAKIGGTLADLAPPSVCAFVWEHGLYRHSPGRIRTSTQTTMGA